MTGSNLCLGAATFNMRRIMVIIASLFAAACATQSGTLMTAEEVVASAQEGVTFVQNEYVESRVDQNPALLLLDVRTEAEFKAGHIPGAQWVPRGRVEFHLAQSVRDADAEIIVYCRTGSRAALVKKALDSQGYENVSAHRGFETSSAAGKSVIVE
jgi:rhodanese-related sulfurtransferase